MPFLELVGIVCIILINVIAAVGLTLILFDEFKK